MSDNKLYDDAIKWIHHVGSESVVIRGSESKLHRVVVNAGLAGTLTIYNNSAASGDVVAAIDILVTGTYEFGGIILPVGLSFNASSGADLTIVYQ